MFPDNYDWRYRVISSLLSPRDNPRHYWLAASGLALTGVLMLLFAELAPAPAIDCTTHGQNERGRLYHRNRCVD